MPDRTLTIGSWEDFVVTQTVGPVINPQTLYFDDLRPDALLCIPEPSGLLLILPAIGIWQMRRRR
jgi:hypothetical protein